MAGWPIVVDYGATYGTTFRLDIREEVALARKEPTPLATVSLVANYATLERWIDVSQLHPSVQNEVTEGKLRLLEGVSFVRFPAKVEQLPEDVKEYALNDKCEVQIFIVPDNDPLMSTLQKKHHLDYVAVRSSNVSGKPEEAFSTGAHQYAQDITAPIVAIRNKTVESREDLRLRIGSQPIIRLPQMNDPAEVEIVRAGNLHPESLILLISSMAMAPQVTHREEKVVTHERTKFKPSSKSKTIQQLRKELQTAAGL